MKREKQEDKTSFSDFKNRVGFIRSETGNLSQLGATVFDPSKEDFYRRCLHTEKNQACFWSGRTADEHGNFYGGQDRAREIAEKNNLKTLEMKLTESHLPFPQSGDTIGWNEFSRIFAEEANGDVSAVLGEEVRSQSVWSKVEYDRLKGSNQIESITRIDPMSERRQVLYQKDNKTRTENAGNKMSMKDYRAKIQDKRSSTTNDLKSAPDKQIKMER